jgi:hypothetical protein
MIFPAATMTHSVLGLDFHKVFVPPVPPPGPPIPHVFAGPIYLWMTPQWPVLGDVLINLKPAACVGSMGFFPHIPTGLPGPESVTNTAYWKRYLVHVLMAAGLAALTLLANLAIAAISTFLPQSGESEAFLKDVTGIDTSSKASIWNSVKANIDAHTKWTSWIKFLTPPMPYPVGHGSISIGSPGVQVNGGMLGFVLCPFAATSCTEFPWVIIPNAATLGFSNVMVGISAAQIARAIAVGAAQRGVAGGVAAGVGKVAQGISHPR